MLHSDAIVVGVSRTQSSQSVDRKYPINSPKENQGRKNYFFRPVTRNMVNVLIRPSETFFTTSAAVPQLLTFIFWLI
jgi:hypothetical protein